MKRRYVYVVRNGVMLLSAHSTRRGALKSYPNVVWQQSPNGQGFNGRDPASPHINWAIRKVELT